MEKYFVRGVSESKDNHVGGNRVEIDANHFNICCTTDELSREAAVSVVLYVGNV